MRKKIEHMITHIILFIINCFLSGTHFFGLKRKLLNLGTNSRIDDSSCIVGPLFFRGKLLCGEKCWINRNFSIEGNGIVSIGDNVHIGPNVTILTGTHEIGNHDCRAGKGVSGNVIIGSGSWICGSSVILPNIEIGSGVVVAAGSVVTKSIPNDFLVAGVPAQLKKKYDE